MKFSDAVVLAKSGNSLGVKNDEGEFILLPDALKMTPDEHPAGDDWQPYRDKDMDPRLRMTFIQAADGFVEIKMNNQTGKWLARYVINKEPVSKQECVTYGEAVRIAKSWIAERKERRRSKGESN